MDMHFTSGVVFALVILSLGQLCYCRAVDQDVTAKNDRSCGPTIYCQGQKFNGTVKLGHNDRFIGCDVALNPKERCCLPQSKHMVCYNIRVDGQYLNFDDSIPNLTTDFSQLCKAMLEAAGKKPGKYSAIVTVDGNGGLFYNNNAFGMADRGKLHIVDLACSFQDDINSRN